MAHPHRSTVVRRPRRTLTPLGPGGRPFARWRWFVALLALAAIAMSVAVLLSARAPDVFGGVSGRVSTELDQQAPEAVDAAERAMRRTGVEEPDTLAHIALWSGAMLLAGLATWSWGSLAVAGCGVLLVSTVLELVQERLSPTRMTERSDLVANAAGVGLGLALVVAISVVIGLPARTRRWQRRRH